MCRDIEIQQDKFSENIEGFNGLLTADRSLDRTQ